jgi:hypothetical protein
MLKRGGSIKAQVTIFIVVVVLIIAIGGVALIFKNNINIPGISNPNTMSPEIQSINSIIKTCTEQRVIDAIRIVGLQGGYVNLPSNYLKTNLSSVAYGYYNGKNTLASKSTIEKEISLYVQFTMPFCIENEFENFNITKSKATVNTKINDDSIIVSSKMPISATKEDKIFTLNNNYEFEVPVRLGNMINVANEIVKKEIEDPKHIDLTYLAGIDYYVLTSPEKENNLIYILTDDKIKLDDIPYSFMFANKIGAII